MPQKAKKEEAMKEKKTQYDGGVISTVVSREMHDALDNLAARLDRPVSWVQRDAFKAYLKNFGAAV